MAAIGNGDGGFSFTGTTSYQTLFNSTDNGGSDGGGVMAYAVRTGADDVYVRVTFKNGESRVYNIAANTQQEIVANGRGACIIMVEAKGELGGVTIYGNVLMP